MDEDAGLANHVGVEIRSGLVDAANRVATERGVDRSAFQVRHGQAARGALLASVAPRLAAVSILFPDPWHCSPERGRTYRPMARALADALLSGGVVFLSSDVQEDELQVDVLNSAQMRRRGLRVCSHEGYG